MSKGSPAGRMALGLLKEPSEAGAAALLARGSAVGGRQEKKTHGELSLQGVVFYLNSERRC